MQSNLFCNNCGPAFNQTNNSVNAQSVLSKMNSYSVPGAYAGTAGPAGQNFHRSFAGQNYYYPNTRTGPAPGSGSGSVHQNIAMQMRANHMQYVQQMHPNQQMHSTAYSNNMQASNVQPSEFTMMHPSPDTMHLYGDLNQYASQNRNLPMQQPNINSIHLLNKNTKNNAVTTHYQNYQQKNNQKNTANTSNLLGGGYQANYGESNNKLLDHKLAQMAGTDRLDRMNSETKKLVEMYKQSTMESSPHNNIYGNYDMVNKTDEFRNYY